VIILKKALKIYKKFLGTDHPDTGRVERNIHQTSEKKKMKKVIRIAGKCDLSLPGISEAASCPPSSDMFTSKKISVPPYFKYEVSRNAL